MNGDLFDWTPPEPDGEALKREGMKRALDHADAVAPGWKVAAGRALDAYLDTLAVGDTFLATDVRAFAENRGLSAPPDNRAWGGILAGARRSARIIGDGYQPSPDPKRHKGPQTRWRKT